MVNNLNQQMFQILANVTKVRDTAQFKLSQGL
jgi:hypothetical protein